MQATENVTQQMKTKAGFCKRSAIEETAIEGFSKVKSHDLGHDTLVETRRNFVRNGFLRCFTR